MQKTLIPDYRSPEFQQLKKVFALLTRYREGEIGEHLSFITHHEISQFYLLLLGKQLAGETKLVSRWEQIKKEILFTNLYYLNHAGRLFSRLKEKKTDVIVLKGLSFISHLYDDIGLRPFCDLDILIHEDDIGTFLTVVEEEGFTLPEGIRDINPGDEFDIYHPVLKIKIDVLTSLNAGAFVCRYFPVDTSGIWERKKSIQTGTTEVYRLSEEDELLYAIVHLAFHIYFQVEIKWLFDLRFFLEKYGSSLDRKYLGEQIRKAGLEHVIVAVSEILTWMFHQDYSAVFGPVKTRFYLFDRTWLKFYLFPPRLFGTSLEFYGVINRMALTFMKYALISRPGDKWKFLTDRIFPDTSRIGFAYTDRLLIPRKIFIPLMQALFLLLSPVVLTFLILIFLGSTLIARMILFKHSFRHG